MTAFATQPARKSLPLQHGMLHVSGAGTDSARLTDAFEVIVDDRSELTLVLLDVTLADEPRPDLRTEALRIISDAVHARAPMYEIVSSLRAFCASRSKLCAAVALLRFSQPDSRVEILNAGMPALACVLPDGGVGLHAALSPPIGRRFGEVHPYELSPLIWGSSWFLLSEGLIGGKNSPDDVRAFLSEHQLLERASELSGSSPEALAALLRDVAEPASQGRLGNMMVVTADPKRRFRSGIQL